jgi:uncharacterized protein YjbI with pentapeptide repeats
MAATIILLTVPAMALQEDGEEQVTGHDVPVSKPTSNENIPESIGDTEPKEPDPTAPDPPGNVDEFSWSNLILGDTAVALLAQAAAAITIFVALIQFIKWSRNAWSRKHDSIDKRRSKAVNFVLGKNCEKEHWGIEFLNSFNSHVLDCKVASTVKSEEPEVKSTQPWQDQSDKFDWTGLECYTVISPGSDRAAQLRRKLLQDFQTEPQASSQSDIRSWYWLTGPAGFGKSTVLQKIYFDLLEEQASPSDQSEPPLVPMLVQPFRSRKSPIEGHEDDEPPEIAKILLEAWLKNRLSKERLPENFDVHVYGEISSQIYSAILTGSIVMLVDGFDEMGNLLRDKLYESLLYHDKGKFVCASRPEAQEPHDDDYAEIVELDRYWTDSQIEEYVSSRLDFSHRLDRDYFNPEVLNNVRIYLCKAAVESWLRIPRMVSLLINQIATKKFRPGEFKSLVEKGEFEVLDWILTSYFKELIKKLKESENLIVSHGMILDQLTEIAEAQRADNDDSRILQDGDPALKVFERAHEFVEVSGHSIKLKNYTFVDFLIAKSRANSIVENQVKGLLKTKYRWSDALIKFLAGQLREHSELVEARIYSALEFARLDRSTTAFPILSDQDKRRDNATDGFNLVNLALELARNDGRNLLSTQYTSDNDDISLSRLDLEKLNFSGQHLNNIVFDHSSLAGADLCHARFEKCQFNGVNFRRSKAIASVFKNCEFDFSEPSKAKESAVFDMVIEKTAFEFNDDFKRRRYTRKSFLDAAALPVDTRYHGPFGWLFRKRADLILGENALRAEECYASLIKDAIDEFGDCGKNRVNMVDLMAGGASDLLVEKFLTSKNIKVLAIDRETSQLADVEALFKENESSEYIPVRQIIGSEGEDDLPTVLKRNDVPHADVIIAKKALHELHVEQQPELIKDCARVLKPGGKLIIFADAPAGGTEGSAIQGQLHEDLQDVRNLLTSHQVEESPYASIQSDAVSQTLETLREALISGQSFSDDNFSRAKFANTWIQIKDWSNDNQHELRNRYFSSQGELISWAEKCGLELVDEPIRFKYWLKPPVFNEGGINDAGEYLRKTGWQIRGESETNHLKKLINGGYKHQFLREFSNYHLDLSKTLGKKISRRSIGVNWTELFTEYGRHELKIDPEGACTVLDQIGMEQAMVSGFWFDVAVMVFQKT